ncbi:NifU family protein [Helicobacter trogontum]|uniref:NifU family protein n=1 Tax=Helicobacter trogontum TaxID=50960 RepID=A0A4U8SFE1_9HELI|nr:NifU family protein [Helicobacter trogontum]TLD84881.1 NifU family protein [Helicobacter trogontum]
MFPFSDSELLAPVTQSINSVRPMLVKDGGDIEIVEIKNACVFVRFRGACSGCSSKNVTLHNAILATLQRDIHPDIKVSEV